MPTTHFLLKAESYKLKAFSGFTAIELLLVLAIVGVISAISLVSLSSINTERALIAETERVLSLVVKARSLTLAAKDGAAYGIHFEARAATIFKGPTYSAGAAGNETQAVHNEVNISAIALIDGGSDVLFKKLSGATAQSGTVTLAAIRDASKTKVITITATGNAYSN